MDYPYRYHRNGLDVEIDTYSVGGTEEGSPHSDRLVELTGWPQWSEVTVRGTVTIESGVFETVLPREGRRGDPPVELVLARECKHTHDRRLVDDLGDDSPLAEGEAYEWELTMEREDVFGRVELTPYLVRKSPGGGPPGKYAWVADQEVATGSPAVLVTDEIETWLEGNMTVRLKPFSKSGLPGENLFSLDDTKSEEPILWINSELDLVSNLLTSRVPAGPKATLRDALATQLAHPVWAQLVLWTATELDEDGTWNHEWQEAVLEQVVAPMWDIDTPEDAAERLREYVSEEAGDGTLRELSGDLNDHLQRQLNSGPQLTDLVQMQEADHR